MRGTTLILGVLVALAPLIAPRAQTPSQLEAGAPPMAQQRYLVGRGLYLDRDFEGAAEEFGAALQIFPTSAKLAFNLARTLERMGRAEEALEHYTRYLELAPQAPDRAAVEGVIAHLRQRIEQTSPRVTLASNPAGARVFIDGATTSAGLTPLELRLAPGVHAARFERDGFAGQLRSFEARAGQRDTVAVDLVPVESADASAHVEEAPPEAPTPWRPALGWTFAGIGLAATGVGAFFHAAAAETAEEGDALGPGRQARASELNDELERQEAWTVTGYAVGGALLAAGVTLLLWPEGEADGAPSVRISPTATGLVVRF